MVKRQQTCTSLWIRRGAGRRLIRVEQQRRLSIDYPAPVVMVAASSHEISAEPDEYDEEVLVHEEEEVQEEQKD